jgi:hypothetical protein
MGSGVKTPSLVGAADSSGDRPDVQHGQIGANNADTAHTPRTDKGGKATRPSAAGTAGRGIEPAEATAIARAAPDDSDVEHVAAMPQVETGAGRPTIATRAAGDLTHVGNAGSATRYHARAACGIIPASAAGDARACGGVQIPSDVQDDARSTAAAWNHSAAAIATHGLAASIQRERAGIFQHNPCPAATAAGNIGAGASIAPANRCADMNIRGRLGVARAISACTTAAATATATTASATVPARAVCRNIARQNVAVPTTATAAAAGQIKRAVVAADATVGTDRRSGASASARIRPGPRTASFAGVAAVAAACFCHAACRAVDNLRPNRRRRSHRQQCPAQRCGAQQRKHRHTMFVGRDDRHESPAR